MIPTGIRACQLGMMAFSAPFIFVYAPALLGWGTIWEVAIVFGTAAIGIIILVARTTGYWMRRATPIERVILLAAALMLLWPDVLISIIGGVLARSVFVWQQFVRPAAKETPNRELEGVGVESP
ncbi:MAG TPA: DUF3394 domain-containing protein [Dehalococcoidia bacterium]|nr:DUF3394 domain-containing protein [Dehalococcoidia bacterium]